MEKHDKKNKIIILLVIAMALMIAREVSADSFSAHLIEVNENWTVYALDYEIGQRHYTAEDGTVFIYDESEPDEAMFEVWQGGKLAGYAEMYADVDTGKVFLEVGGKK